VLAVMMTATADVVTDGATDGRACNHAEGSEGQPGDSADQSATTGRAESPPDAAADILGEVADRTANLTPQPTPGQGTHRSTQDETAHRAYSTTKKSTYASKKAHRCILQTIQSLQIKCTLADGFVYPLRKDFRTDNKKSLPVPSRTAR
jgi:hypothetical protein